MMTADMQMTALVSRESFRASILTFLIRQANTRAMTCRIEMYDTATTQKTMKQMELLHLLITKNVVTPCSYQSKNNYEFVYTLHIHVLTFITSSPIECCLTTFPVTISGTSIGARISIFNATIKSSTSSKCQSRHCCIKKH